MTPASPTATRGQIILAFALLYVIWGSTYLAIRMAVHELPPLAMAGMRFCIAGAAMHVFFRLRGEPVLTPGQWTGASIVGILLLVFGNGLVCLAEVHVPSGVSALTTAATQLFMTIMAWMAGQSARPPMLVWLGIALGLGGVAWLVQPDLADAMHHGVASSAALPGELMLLGASCAWAGGAVWSRALPAPRSPFMAAAAQSWVGGLVLVAVSIAFGEWHQGMLAKATWQGWSAMLYLITFGSVLGYGSFIFLLRHVQPTLVATYAFVNPLIAVLLGCLVKEAFTLQIAEAAALIIAAVAIVIFFGRSAKGPAARGTTTAITRPPSSARVGRTTTRPR